jgi:hypothetical protein
MPTAADTPLALNDALHAVAEAEVHISTGTAVSQTDSQELRP